MTGTVYAGIGTSSGSTSALALAQLGNVQVTLPPAVTSSTTATATSEGPFSYTITGSNNPTAFNATGLPSGLSVNPTTGLISGSATALGAYPVILSVTNAYGTATQTLTLTVAPASLTWTGSVNTTWDSTTLNWTNGSNPVTYVDGDAVTFSDTGSGGSLTLSTSFHPLSVTASNSTKSYTLTGSAGLTGTTTLTKTGTGTLTLSEPNTFTGLTTVNGGTLQYKGSSAWPTGSALSLGSATVVIDNDGSGSNGTIALGNNVTLDTSATATISVANNGSSNTGNQVAFGALNNGTAAQGFNSTFNFVGANGYAQSFTSLGLTGSTGYATTLNPTSSPVTIAGNVINQQTSYSGHYDTLDLKGTVAGNSITGVIADSSGYTSVGNGDTRLTANGTGTWTLSGASTYHGPTALSSGTLILTGSWANTQSVTTSGTGILNESSTGVIGGTATLTQNSTGTSTLSGTNTYSGATTVSQGTLLVNGSITSAVSVASGATLGGSGTITGNVTVATGAKLLYSLPSTGIAGLVIHGNLALNGTINVTPPGSGTLNPGIYTLATYSGTLSGTPTFVWTPPTGNSDTATFSTSTPGVIQVVVSSTAPTSSNLSLWFKADALPTNSTTVGSWTDSSGSGTVVSQTGSAMPTYIASDVNGHPAVRFNGSQYLSNASYANRSLNAALTIITVGMTTSPGTQQYSAWVGSSPGTCRGIGYYASGEDFNFYNNYVQGIASPNANTFVAEIGSINSSLNTVTFYRNGVQTYTVPTSGIGALSSGLTIGSSCTGVAWQGDIGEVLIYNTQLSSAQLAQIDGYLANKYGYYGPNATWPSSFTPAVQAEIARNQWSYAQANAYVAFQAANPTMLTNGLQAWYRADTGFVQSNGVTTWTDQTGNNTVTQATSANEPTYVTNDVNGNPAVRFNGNQWLFNPRNIGPGVNADMTMITVGMSTSPSSQQYSISMGNTPLDTGPSATMRAPKILTSTTITSRVTQRPMPIPLSWKRQVLTPLSTPLPFTEMEYRRCSSLQAVLVLSLLG